MTYTRTATRTDALDALKNYFRELQAPALRKPAWPLIKRLIARETEMRSVWKEIARYGLSWQQCHSLLEQIVFASRSGADAAVQRLKGDYRQLTSDDDMPGFISWIK